jgi:hypothetical protein
VLKAGSATAIEIPYTGCPQPKATWKYKSGKLPDAKRFKTDIIKTMTSMTIAKALRSDSGKYTLLLENEYGSATFNIEIVVLGESFEHHYLIKFLFLILFIRQTWTC